MPKIKANRTTFLKSEPAPSDKLASENKIAIAAGTEIEVNWIYPDRAQHDRMELTQQRYGRFNWYVYAPHFDRVDSPTEQFVNAIASKVIKAIDFSSGSKQQEEIKLNVPYFDQRDNWEMIDHVPDFGYPDRTCCTTSNAMMLAYLLGDAEVKRRKAEAGVEQFETLYAEAVAQYGDSTDHNAQTKALEDFKVESYWTTTASPSDVILSLKAGFPVVGGFCYKGSGHICLIVGFRGDGFYVHDPYGARAGTADYYAIKNNDDGYNDHGKFDFYSNGAMGALLWESDAPRSENPEAGWCRFVTAVNGKRTGIPDNL